MRLFRTSSVVLPPGPPAPLPGKLGGGGLILLGLFSVGVTGCTAPKVSQQKLLSQPSMTFGASRIWTHDPGLTVQLEPGRANSGGGSAAGCTSCR